MSEQVCVCGHKHVALVDDDERSTGETWCANKWTGNGCQCRDFRPVLDWPDSVGIWWCDYFGAPVKVESDIRGLIVGGPDEWFRERDFKALVVGARFVKLLEPNPFQGA